VIDSQGYRANVGIILCNRGARLLWCKRIGQNAWQFPQGGMQQHESPQQALFRELREETGLWPEHVQVMGQTEGWLRYRLPRYLIRRHSVPCCIGQKQKWFMLRLVGDEECVNLRCCNNPEFDVWRWVDYWRPMREVVFFKRRVYLLALHEFAPLIFEESLPPILSYIKDTC
jgi:putative (di)nucleoside polyphosphate hydrolase